MSMVVGVQREVDSCDLPVEVQLKALEEANDGEVTQGKMYVVGMTIGRGGREDAFRPKGCMLITRYSDAAA